NEGGVSNYGVHAMTIVPYTLGFGLCGAFTLYAAGQASAEPERYAGLVKPLVLLGALYLATLISTYRYKTNSTLDNIHIYISITLVITEVVLGVWLAVHVVRDRINWALLTAQGIGFALGVLNYLHLIHILFAIELVTSLAFGALLVRTAAKLGMPARQGH